MNDRDFDDAREAVDWIRLVEGPGSESRERQLTPFFNSLLGEAGVGEILDIGCGQGACRSLIDHKRWTYWGIDPSHHLLARARELHTEASKYFAPGNAYAIPFEDSRFSAAFSVNVWHLLSKMDLAAREMMRVLKPNGSFLVITGHPQSISIWAGYFQAHQLNGQRLIGENIRPDGSKAIDELYFHTEDEISRKLVESGAHGIKMEGFRFTEASVPMYLAISGKKRGDT